MDLISVGQPVAVEISGTRVAGAIERIGLTAQSASDGGTPTVELDIAIDVGDAEIISGTSTIVEVLIGEIVDDHPGRAWLKTSVGGNRIIDMLAGEQLPRIC